MFCNWESALSPSVLVTFVTAVASMEINRRNYFWVTYVHSSYPIIVIFFFLVLNMDQNGRILQVQQDCYCWISCCLPEGEVFIWDFREQESFHNLNYHKVNLQLSIQVVLRLAGKQLWPKSYVETKLNCHQCLSLNDSSKESFW